MTRRQREDVRMAKRRRELRRERARAWAEQRDQQCCSSKSSRTAARATVESVAIERHLERERHRIVREARIRAAVDGPLCFATRDRLTWRPNAPA